MSEPVSQMFVSTQHKCLLLTAACSLAVKMASGQSTYDPSTVLARTRDKVVGLEERLPRYTCRQTVNRTYFRSTIKPRSGTSCDQFAGDNKLGRRRLQIEATDRLRLDVIVTGGQEVFSWAGASHFDSRWIAEIIGEGPVGTGAFGTFLFDIFRNDGVNFEFVTTARLRDKVMLQYAYQVPEEASHYYTRRTDKKWSTTAFSGSLWVNPETDELERLTVLTSELPPETGACTAETRVDYQTVRLGTGGFLLALESELHFLLRDGTESTSISTYEGCREYAAESSLSVGEPPIAAQPRIVATSSPPVSIPNGVPVTLALVTPINTDTAAAGDVIAAKVKRSVLDPKSQRNLISAGAIVQGRIVRLEHRFLPTPHFLISISWATIADHNAVAPFFARIAQADSGHPNGQAYFQNGRLRIWLPPPGESQRAGGWFILPTQKKTYVVQPGYETEWLTATAPEFK